jgi:hypothetical protein
MPSATTATATVTAPRRLIQIPTTQPLLDLLADVTPGQTDTNADHVGLAKLPAPWRDPADQ